MSNQLVSQISTTSVMQILPDQVAENIQRETIERIEIECDIIDKCLITLMNTNLALGQSITKIHELLMNDPTMHWQEVKFKDVFESLIEQRFGRKKHGPII